MMIDKSGDPVSEATMLKIPANRIPMYGIRFKIPVIIPSKMAYFKPIIINPKVVKIETTIISIIKPTM